MRGRAALALLIFLACTASFAQELSPRAYWPAPEGTRILALAYAFSSGDVVTDPSLPISGADSTLHRFIAGYFHTLSVFDRTSNVVIELPYAWGTTSGLVGGQFRERNLSNVGDLAVTFSINLTGAPSMNREEFIALTQNPHPILALSLKVVAPTGDYEADKLINVGSNRWAAKAELGYILPLTADWHFELEAGAWFFEDNDDFFGETTREQAPIYAAETHLVRRFGGGRWASLEANFYRGGRTTVGNVERGDLERNSTLGASFLFPVGKRSSLRMALSTGLATTSGGDYRTIVLNYIRVL
jgi:hypothetical protein